MRLLLADFLLYLHLAYVAFVIAVPALVLLGGGLGWNWVRSARLRGVHFLMIFIPVLESVSGVLCPLTTWEMQLRAAAGQQASDVGLVARLARDLLFVEASPRTLMWCYLVFFACVLATFWLVPPRRRVRPDPVRPTGTPPP